jgi:5-methylcytosine-specific restriction protein A
VEHAKQCDGIGTDADHIQPGDNHHLDNLQWLSEPCHRAKTAAEAAARNQARTRARLRPTEQHPGRRT